jgi:hypothetical protein
MVRISNKKMLFSSSEKSNYQIHVDTTTNTTHISLYDYHFIKSWFKENKPTSDH